MLDQATVLSYPDPALTDGVVALRRWTTSDLGCAEEAIRDPPEGTPVLAHVTPIEGPAWIERQWGRADNGEGLSLAIAEAGTNEAIGAIVLLLRSQPGTADLGYWLIERVRGRGLASRAIPLLVRWALADAGLHRVQAHVEPNNVASRRVLENAGFELEGHLRSFLAFGDRRADALVYSLLPSDLV